jgi:hypothetical protein
MGTDSPVLVEILYGLYAPLVLFRQKAYALKRSASTFWAEARLRYGLLDAAYYSLTHEDQLAACGAPIEYSPRLTGWRSYRASNPTRYWWQGISEERFDSAKAFFFVPGTTTAWSELPPLAQFRSTYAAAYVSAWGGQEDLGLLANALYGFTPLTRPIFWRLLVVWRRLYSTYASVMRSEVTDLNSLARRLLSPEPGYEPAATPPSDSLYEPFPATSNAVSQFLERFVLPRIEALLAAPEPPGEAAGVGHEE